VIVTPAERRVVLLMGQLSSPHCIELATRSGPRIVLVCNIWEKSDLSMMSYIDGCCEDFLECS